MTAYGLLARGYKKEVVLNVKENSETYELTLEQESWVWTILNSLYVISIALLCGVFFSYKAYTNYKKKIGDHGADSRKSYTDECGYVLGSIKWLVFKVSGVLLHNTDILLDIGYIITTPIHSPYVAALSLAFILIPTAITMYLVTIYNYDAGF